MKKIPVFVDCDDTILRSSDAVIKILNEKYGKNKTYNDLMDLSYQSIVKGVRLDEINDIYSSNTFWETVEVDQEFLKVYKEFCKVFSWKIVTKGSKANIALKKLMLDALLDPKGDLGLEFYGLPYNGPCDTNKASIPMSGGIQIDDQTACVPNTTASVKIVPQQFHVKPWNRPIPNVDNLYIVQDWKDIRALLRFFADNQEFVTRGC